MANKCFVFFVCFFCLFVELSKTVIPKKKADKFCYFEPTPSPRGVGFREAVKPTGTHIHRNYSV